MVARSRGFRASLWRGRGSAAFAGGIRLVIAAVTVDRAGTSVDLIEVSD
jgi:hypothetical protein